ncbi:hypothetical protein ACFL6C_06740 [Myxococcota bacterium]
MRAALQKLDAYLRTGANDYLASVVFGEPVHLREVDRASEVWGHPFAGDYVEFLTTHGTFHINDHEGVEYCRLMGPQECLEARDWMASYVKDDAIMGPGDQGLREARNEQAVRKDMFPFQCCEETDVKSYYCFFAGRVKDGQPLIYPVAHDDYRVSHYIYNQSADDIFAFNRHIDWLVGEIMANKFP